MESKPLSPERRAEIEQLLALNKQLLALNQLAAHGICDDALRDLLAAERLWRETVKNADVCGEIGAKCPFCSAVSYDRLVEAPHAPNCAWVLAQL